MSMNKLQQKNRRHNRIRKLIKGTRDIPRVCVFRSNRYIYIQIVDDDSKKTMLSADDKSTSLKGNKTQRAGELAESLGSKAVAQGISKIVFDRAGYKYHGRVKSVAEGLRKAGLQF